MNRHFARRALNASDGEYILWHILDWLRNNHDGNADFCATCKATETICNLIQLVQRETAAN